MNRSQNKERNSEYNSICFPVVMFRNKEPKAAAPVF